jgi:PAS domain S-box-containing protein
VAGRQQPVLDDVTGKTGKGIFALVLKHSSISGQVFATSLFCGAIFAVFFSVIHAFVGYRQDVALTDSNMEAAGRFCSSELSAGLDAMDPGKMRAILQGALDLSGMSSIELRGKLKDRDISVRLGAPEGREAIQKPFPVASRKVSMGGSITVVIRADLARLKHRAWRKGMEDFLFMMLSAGAFSVALFVLIRNVLTHNLLSFIKYTDNLKFDELDLPFVLTGRKRIGSTPDEFDLLATAMNTMRERLVRNLIQRRETEALRTRERALLVALINSIPDLIFYKDIYSVYLGCNTAFEEFSGWKMQDLIGRTDLDLFPRHLAEFFRTQDREMFAVGGPRSNEEWVTYPDGRKVLLDTLKTVYRDEDGAVLGLLGISRDITGRKVVEDELTAAQERFEKAFNASPMMIIVLDGKSERLIDANLCCLQKTGYDKDEFLSRTMADLGFWSDLDVQRRLIQLVEKDETINEFPAKIRKKSGENINCLLTGRKVTFSGRPCLLIFLEDITLRKQAEETMRRSMKMDAVGQVTGGIAHDFNNILGIIIGNLDFVKRFGTPNDLILKRVEAAAKASERAAMLTRQLLDFSRQHARDCEPTDINRVIRGMDSLIARSVTPEVEVVVDLCPDLWIVDIDRGDFENVLLNLVINARDAMPEGGRLHISTANTSLDEYYTLMNPGLNPGDHVLLAVRDGGVGIPSEVLEHVFEPFYTTKPQGKGTGLGLSMVYAFSQRSEGSVRIYSEVGVGTTVHVYLPRTKKSVHGRTDASRVMPGLPGGDETILVVDDEVDLLILAEDMLKILGYTTLTCKNGNEAVNVLLSKGNTIDLLFTDVVMPGGINGFELAEQALLLNPELKILFTSGYIEKAVPKTGQFSFKPQILFKPYNELDLAISIREVLDGQ